jgi:antitoxin component YwqK of YwqJK toxin-antitoxin module
MFRLLTFLTVFLFFATTALAQTTAPSALTTAGGPPVAVPKKQKGGFLKKVAEQSGIPKDIISDPLSTTSYGLPGGISSKDSIGGMLTSALGSDVMDLGLKVKSFIKKKDNKREKKKASKTDYEGLPMARQYTKIGSGDRTIIEEFHVLKNWQDPNPYIRERFGFSPKEGRVKQLGNDLDGVYLLHGPYKRYQNGDLVEEGYYYAGTKDGRWERYDSKFMLIDKTYYRRGFPAEAYVAYYDSAHTKLKEVVPYMFGKQTGTYLSFHPNGQLAEEGKYDNGVKVGRWTEFHPIATRRFRKRITQYVKDRWEDPAEPLVLAEWDEKGKQTYERPKEAKAAEEEEGE